MRQCAAKVLTDHSAGAMDVLCNVAACMQMRRMLKVPHLPMVLKKTFDAQCSAHAVVVEDLPGEVW